MDKSKIIIYLNIFLIFAFVLVNLFTVFMPEMGFDALWYHLTLPKLWLMKHQWYFPGGLLQYSAMPRLAETIFIPLVKYTDTIGPKLVQFIAGLITAFIIYRIVINLTKNKLWSIIAANLFYATWLVSWQSASAYVDLIRTCLETSALYFIIKHLFITPSYPPPLNLSRSIGRWGSIILPGIFLGLAIGTKWHALGSLALFTLLFNRSILGIALITALPWFYLAYHFTGNPIYPLLEHQTHLTQISQLAANFYQPLTILGRLVTIPYHLTFPADDFLSPLIGLLFIVSLASLFSSNQMIRKITLYSFLGTIFALFTPPPSSRYLLPFLPALIIAAVYPLSKIKFRYAFYLCLIFITSGFLILSLRLYSLKKFIPLVQGKINRNEFLASQIFRLPGTLIDVDDFITRNLNPQSKILIDKYHNLYYFPHNFDHTSWADKNTHYDYLITFAEDPDNINGQLLHTNSLGTQVFHLKTLKTLF